MSKYGLLTTFVVLMCMLHINSDAATSELTSLNSTLSRKWDFRTKVTKLETKYFSSQSKPYKRDIGSLLEYLFFNDHVFGNKSVIRYAEIQKYLQEIKKQGNPMRRALNHFPEILIRADQLLKSYKPKQKFTANKKKTSKLYLNKKNTIASTSKRTTRNELKYWVRDYRFEKTLRPINARKRAGAYTPRQGNGSSYSNNYRNNSLRESNKIKDYYVSKRKIRRNNQDNKNETVKGAGHKKKEKVIPEDLSPYSILHQIKNKIKPELERMGANITVEVLGRTLEYNDIVMIKASALPKSLRSQDDKYDDIVAEKKIVLIVHGLAAMGYKMLPCLSTIGGLTKLMSYYYEHLQHFDIFVIPMANPDGIAAWTKVYWNKNMSPQLTCPGVALDRNFDVAWNESSNTNNSCGQHYRGAEPFSEPETQVLKDVFHKYSHKIIGYFHVHASSYNDDIFKGDAALYPKGYAEMSIDDDRYVDLKAEIDDLIRNATFKVYSFTIDTLYSWYGKVAGTSVDYAASVYDVPFSMELVMQLYQDNMLVDKTEERETAIVFTEVWRNVIDTIFKFMHKSLMTMDRK